VVIGRFSIFLAKLDPVTGAETAKTRPCLVMGELFAP
jgi:mRNA-degrading endonuclease toxin of MazEF toxin-antitoxin module